MEGHYKLRIAILPAPIQGTALLKDFCSPPLEGCSRRRSTE